MHINAEISHPDFLHKEHRIHVDEMFAILLLEEQHFAHGSHAKFSLHLVIQENSELIWYVQKCNLKLCK